MSQHGILEKYSTDFKKNWLDIYRKAEKMGETRGKTRTSKSVKNTAEALKKAVKISSTSTSEAGLAVSYLLDTMVNTVDIALEEGDSKKDREMAELIELVSKTSVYMIDRNAENKKFWKHIDESETLDNLETVLKADTTIN